MQFSIGRLPVEEDCRLNLRQWHASVTHATLKRSLKLVLALRAVVASPRLKLEVLQIPRMAADCEWHLVVELIVDGTGRREPLLAQQLGLDTIRV